MKKLPKKVILANVKERLEETYTKKQDSLQEATAKISELRNLKIETVEQLEKVSKEWIEEEITKSKKNLNTVFGSSGGFIPAGIAKQFSDEYERVRRDCQQPIDTITAHLAWCKEKGIGIKMDSKGRPWLNEKDLKEVVEREATHTFSEEETEYYEHFQAIFEAMDALQDYESKNGFEPSNLQGVITDRFLCCYHVDMETLKEVRRPFQYTPEEYYRVLCSGCVLRKRHYAVLNDDEE